ncbi:MAG: ABC transporter ATP-binding protein/permease [Thermodesulfobacteriota bacterium]
MGKKEPPVTERSLISWAFASNMRLQLLLLLIIMITVFARVIPLEMQKRIVNEAIKFRQMELLAIYCGIYLAAVVIATGLKYLINLLQAVIGERALREMRLALFEHILVLPLSFFRRTQPGTVVSFLLTELSTAGNFAGMALATPIVNILTLMAFAGYLVWLNPLLGAISLAIYPIVLVLVPLLQKGANRQNKRRVDISRDLSGKIAESVSGIQEIQGNGAFTVENRKYRDLVVRLQKIRIVWNAFLFGVKSVNNLFSSLGPLVVFVLGGYLTMRGRLELGALVAFLSAQEKLYDPWKELIEFYQVYQDASVRYRRTMEYFRGEPEFRLTSPERPPYRFEGRLHINRLSFSTEDGVRLLDDVSLNLRPGEHLALIGFSGSGKSTLVQCIGQLFRYSGGQILLDDRDVADLSKKDVVDNVGIISQAPFIFVGSIEDNLLYACKAAGWGGEENPLPNLDRMIAILQQVGLFVDVLHFGLNAMLDRARHGDMASLLIRMRKHFQQDFGQGLAEYVEFFHDGNYLYYSSVAENIIFGVSHSPDFDPWMLEKQDDFVAFLEQAGLLSPLLNLGYGLAARTVDILGNLPPEAAFFEQSPIAADELGAYKELIGRVKDTPPRQAAEPDKRMLLALGLRFCPGKHKMAALTGALTKQLLEGRALFRDSVMKRNPEAFSSFQPATYLPSQTILSNILFGKPKSNAPGVQEKISQKIVHLLIEEDMLEPMIAIGLQYRVGNKGENLSGGQRQKLAVARVLLKSPKYLLMDEATAALDNKSQARIQNMLETRLRGNTTVISVAHRLDIVRNYDTIAVMKAGKIVEMGTYDQLLHQRGVLHELVHGNK